MGMPILYYKANITGTSHTYYQESDPCRVTNVYDNWDNQYLVNIPVPWNYPRVHPMAGLGSTGSGGTTSEGTTSNASIFYTKTRDNKVPTGDRPYRTDSYILISAGFDGEYGTSDDIFNFGD